MPAVTVTSGHAAPNTNWLQNAKFVSSLDAKLFITEVYRQKVYEQAGIRLHRGGTVIDVGANIGIFAAYAADMVGPQGLVLALEPIPRTYKALEHNLRIHAEHSNSAARVCPLQLGVGDGTETAATFVCYPNAAGWGSMQRYDAPDAISADMETFFNNALTVNNETFPRGLAWASRMLHRASPSLYRAAGQMAVKWLQSGRECVQCRLTSVSHLLRRHGISSVDLLKIDVERAELDVLRGVRAEDWLSISQVAMEVHEEHIEEVKCLLQYVAKFDRVEFMQTPDLVGTSIFMGYSSRS